MSHESVKPLFEDATASSELRNFVTLARSDGASQADLDRLAKRMAPVLGVSAAFVASSAAAGGSAPVTAASAFGAPGSGLTPAIGGVLSAGKVSATGSAVAKGAAGAGLFSQLMATTSAKLVAIGLSIGAAGVGIYSMTSSERPPSGPQVSVARHGAAPQPNTLPGESTASTAVSAAAAAPLVEAGGSEPEQNNDGPAAAPRAVPAHSARASLAARAPAAARRSTPSAQRATPEPTAEVASAAQAVTDEPIAEQAVAVDEPALAPALPLPSELSLIEGAEASRSRGEQALALLAKHEKLYPRGALAQEREVLAIELLLKAGKQSQAEARAERFEDDFPRSAHLPRLRAMLKRANAR